MTKTLTVRSDDQGCYQTTEVFSPPGPFGFHVKLYCTFTAPEGAHILGNVALESAGAKAQSADFEADAGGKISLGSWHVAHGPNTIVVTGQTSPVLANTDITLIVEADIGGF